MISALLFNPILLWTMNMFEVMGNIDGNDIVDERAVERKDLGNDVM
jgi:hypothetical protein